MPIPPRWLRRLVLDPLVLVIALGALLTLPLWLIIAAFGSRFVPGRWRPIRLLWFATVYVALEAIALVACFALWIASGFGWKIRGPRFAEAHYRLVGWVLARLVNVGRWTFNVSLELPRPDATPDAPRIVMSRHAGPGDSFLLVHSVLVERGRRPRIVLKDTFQWDPMFDVILNRIPCSFVSPNPKPGKGAIERIAAMAAGMGPRDSLIIFPEGGNITEKRRLRSIAKLEETGRADEAERARRMRHLMAPRPGGALAAIEACPEAEVVFVGHTGLEDLSTPVDLWRGIPMDSSVHARSWTVRPDEIPESHEERVLWLYEWWKRIDAWIGEVQERSWALY